MKNKDYWAERMANTQARLTNKNIKQIEKQLRKYYNSASKNVIAEFEATYDKIQATKEEGREPTPADLYNLDRYWQAQRQLKNELQKLGDRQIKKLNEVFRLQFFDIYYSIALKGQKAFNTINAEGAQELINAIWCVDGKSFSDRVWENTKQLAETLNEGLIDCLITGKKTTQLKNELQERFSVSYNRADAVVRTEMSHIQNTAAQQRYKDYGVTKYEVWADYDERRCDTCGKLHQTTFSIFEKSPVPVHPRCRCSIIPVVED